MEKLREFVTISWASSLSASSPAPWPSSSLTALKKSMSTSTSDSGSAKRVGRELAAHFLFADARGEDVVLSDREAEHVAVAQEERPGLGVGEPPRFGHDAIEQGRHIALAGERDADLDQLLQARGWAPVILDRRLDRSVA